MGGELELTSFSCDECSSHELIEVLIGKGAECSVFYEINSFQSGPSDDLRIAIVDANSSSPVVKLSWEYGNNIKYNTKVASSIVRFLSDDKDSLNIHDSFLRKAFKIGYSISVKINRDKVREFDQYIKNYKAKKTESYIFCDEGRRKISLLHVDIDQSAENAVAISICSIPKSMGKYANKSRALLSEILHIINNLSGFTKINSNN